MPRFREPRIPGTPHRLTPFPDDVRVVEVGATEGTGDRCGQEGPGRFAAQGSTRALHLQRTATLLNDGRVLATGGFGSPSRSAPARR